MEEDGEAGTWLPLREAGPRLGLDPVALRSRIRRRAVTAKKGNDGRLLVFVAAGPQPGHGEAGPDDGRAATGPNEAADPVAAELLAELDHMRREHGEALDRARAETAEARIAAARAEAERDARERLIGELRAMLADARRSWWRRWIGS